MASVLSNILNILITILVFFTIILIHEMGHFLTAKAFGMKIYEFSIGMGPRLFSKRTKTTLWSFILSASHTLTLNPVGPP